MNILLISSLSKGLEKLILINLIQQNLISFYKNQNLKFDLIINELFVSENIFFKKSNFNIIKRSFGLKELWDKRSDPYDLIINLDKQKFYNRLLSKIRRNYLTKYYKISEKIFY